jgi:hypothetical protein
MDGTGIEVKEKMEHSGFQRMECTVNDWKSIRRKGVKNLQ